MSLLMKKHIITSVKYIVLMNIAFFIGAFLLGMEFNFNYVTNIVVPILCAEANMTAVSMGLNE